MCCVPTYWRSNTSYTDLFDRMCPSQAASQSPLSRRRSTWLGLMCSGVRLSGYFQHRIQKHEDCSTSGMRDLCTITTQAQTHTGWSTTTVQISLKWLNVNRHYSPWCFGYPYLLLYRTIHELSISIFISKSNSGLCYMCLIYHTAYPTNLAKKVTLTFDHTIQFLHGAMQLQPCSKSSSHINGLSWL